MYYKLKDSFQSRKSMYSIHDGIEAVSCNYIVKVKQFTVVEWARLIPFDELMTGEGLEVN